LTRSAVLIVTNEQDVGADFVVRELDDRGVHVVRLNSERSPDWQLSLQPGGSWQVRSPTRRLHSDACSGVWWRRPEVPAPLPGTEPAAEAIADQWGAFLAALATVPGPTWVSPPSAIRVAEDKAFQLHRARSAGFLVPDTLWSNDIAAVRAFTADRSSQVVVKSVATAWWEAEGHGRFVFASVVDFDSLPPRGRLATAPLCFQQRVHPKRDVRVTVVDTAAFAAVRDVCAASAANEPLDWRRASQHDWRPHDLPTGVARACCELVAGLGLRFSGIDLALDDDGRYWFLELNPNGEWGWLQRSGLPIAETLADTLSRRAG
jgi:hypothetical protein